MSLGDADNKDASFYFLLFACVLSVVVLCFMLWVTTWTLMRAAMQSRRETLSKALESRTAYDAVLAGVATAADPDADLFPGVAHPRLLVFCCTFVREAITHRTACRSRTTLPTYSQTS